MIRSVDTGNIKLLKSLIEKAAFSLDQVDEDGNNLLHRAVLAGRKEITKYISRKCENLMMQWNIYGLAPVHLALLSNRPRLVESFLWFTKREEKYKDIKTRDNLTLLQYMVKYSHPSIVKLYLNDFGGGGMKKSLKSKINEPNIYGQTAMHVAGASGFRETITLLYEHGGDLFKRDSEGMLPFHHSLSNGFLFTATFIIRLMDKQPEDFINDDLKGSSCLLKSCKNSFDPSTVKMIIKWGGNVKKLDKEGKNAIYYASINSKISLELLEMLKI